VGSGRHAEQTSCVEDARFARRSVALSFSLRRRR
jgi:hypothetical protein